MADKGLTLQVFFFGLHAVYWLTWACPLAGKHTLPDIGMSSQRGRQRNTSTQSVQKKKKDFLIDQSAVTVPGM